MSIVLLAMLVCADPAPKGHVIPIGGGDISAELADRIIQTAGGKNVKTLVVTQSSELPDAAESSMKRWKERGLTNVSALNLNDKAAAEAQVNGADFIWIGGGDQNRLMKAIEGTKIAELIRRRYHDGATIAGTSAGAAVMSSVMITGKAELNALKREATETAKGIGLWPGVIVDQHFVKRTRINRLLSAVLDKPELVGVGIDEGTGVIVKGDKAEVVGAGQVVVIDARKADIKPGSKGALHESRGVTIAVYKAGETFEVK